MAFFKKLLIQIQLQQLSKGEASLISIFLSVFEQDALGVPIGT